MTVSILGAVVVAYGGADDLSHCLATLGPTFRIVVVDNSSELAVRRAADGAGAEYVDTGSNLGFAAGVNVGLSRLPLETDVLVLNPDAAITPYDVEVMRNALDADAGLAAASPSLLGLDGLPQRVCWPFPTPARMWVEAMGFGRRLARDEEYVVGSVLLIRRKALDDVGAFDERFFLYAEETDWQRRATDRGWRVGVVEAASATHRGAGTSSDAVRREVLFHAAAETYIRKWHGRRGWAAYRAAAVAGATIRASVGPRSSRRSARSRVVTYLRGPRRIAGFK